MINKKTKYARLTITIPEDLFKRFKKYCTENSINMSAKISKMIQKGLENKNYNK